MSESKHTPGPWRIDGDNIVADEIDNEDYDNDGHYDDDDYDDVAKDGYDDDDVIVEVLIARIGNANTVHIPPPGDQPAANMRLILAAPVMYLLLCDTVVLLAGLGVVGPTCDAIEKVLADILGEVTT